MIRINDRIAIDEDEDRRVFSRAGGPCGQNVNKVATVVQLRFDAARSRGSDERGFMRLRRHAKRRLTADGSPENSRTDSRTGHLANDAAKQARPRLHHAPPPAGRATDGMIGRRPAFSIDRGQWISRPSVR
jgi:ribosome-associated protein